MTIKFLSNVLLRPSLDINMIQSSKYSEACIKHDFNKQETTILITFPSQCETSDSLKVKNARLRGQFVHIRDQPNKFSRFIRILQNFLVSHIAKVKSDNWKFEECIN